MYISLRFSHWPSCLLPHTFRMEDYLPKNKLKHFMVLCCCVQYSSRRSYGLVVVWVIISVLGSCLFSSFLRRIEWYSSSPSWLTIMDSKTYRIETLDKWEQRMESSCSTSSCFKSTQFLVRLICYMKGRSNMNLKSFLGGVHFKLEKESELWYDDAKVAPLYPHRIPLVKYAWYKWGLEHIEGYINCTSLKLNASLLPYTAWKALVGVANKTHTW